MLFVFGQSEHMVGFQGSALRCRWGGPASFMSFTTLLVLPRVLYLRRPSILTHVKKCTLNFKYEMFQRKKRLLIVPTVTRDLGKWGILRLLFVFWLSFVNTRHWYHHHHCDCYHQSFFFFFFSKSPASLLLPACLHSHFGHNHTWKKTCTIKKTCIIVLNCVFIKWWSLSKGSIPSRHSRPVLTRFC